MTSSVSRAGRLPRNHVHSVVQKDYTPPLESPDSIRLLGPIWTASGLTLHEGCRLYVGDHWRSGTITATGATFALVKTQEGTSRCNDRRNLLTKEEARLFKNAQARFRRQREGVLNSLGMALEEEKGDE